MTPARKRYRITAARAWTLPSFRELWEFRELLLMLTLRDIKVRYKQTAIGILWAIIQPVMTMVVFTVIFGRIAALPSDGLPYPIFVFTAILPWQLFAKALTQGSTSMVSLGAMMGKVYFPRLIAPSSGVLGGLADFGIGFIILICLMLWYGTSPGPELILAPFFVLLAVVMALAVSLWLSILNAEYRDVQYTLPFLSQIWMYLTPVIYPSSMVPEKWRVLYALNPIVSVVEGFRWTLVGGRAPDLIALMVSVASAFIILGLGLLYFSRYEKTFVDRL